jgi:hypothetical protein
LAAANTTTPPTLLNGWKRSAYNEKQTSLKNKLENIPNLE